jgi:hypothetical protein
MGRGPATARKIHMPGGVVASQLTLILTLFDRLHEIAQVEIGWPAPYPGSFGFVRLHSAGRATSVASACRVRSRAWISCGV